MTQNTAPQYDRVIGVCHLSENPYDRTSAVNSMSVADEAVWYLVNKDHSKVSGQSGVSVLQIPSHGTLVDVGKGSFAYYPEKGYLGNDRASLLVEVGGKKVRMEYFFRVIQAVPEAAEGEPSIYEQGYCPKKARVWKISSIRDVNGNNTLAALELGAVTSGTVEFSATGMDSLSSWLRAAQLDGRIADLSGINVTVTDLPSAAVGQTVGSNITLDTNAAGNGWFIDTTPADNSEYLPTSNPNEWVAKEGSDAYGKIDMLSVLLHEYGHVLGLDHGDDSHSLMSPELKPGVRHTVSTAEMNAIADHLGIGLPSDPSVPFNPLPWSTSLLFGFTRLRREATGNGIVLPPLPDSDTNATSVTPAPIYSMSVNYQEALHTGLYNGDFALTDPASVTYGWNTHGNVSLTNGIAEIAEDARAMSGLTQTFIKPEGITALRFTIEGAEFGTDGSAPPDAFEVALLDAETGQSVVGAAGLSHTDALLNIQADGTAR